MRAKILTLSVLIIAVLVSSGCVQNQTFTNDALEKKCEPDYLLSPFTNEELNNIFMGGNPSEICESNCFDKRDVRSFKLEYSGATGWFGGYNCYCDMNDCGDKISNYTGSDEFINQSKSVLQFCSKAQLMIQGAYYDSGTKELTLSLFNTGDFSLNGFDVKVIYQNESITSSKFENLNISNQTIKTVILIVDNTLKQITVQSLQCRGAQDLIGRYDIEGF
jgi:hypothetical protein